MICVVSVICLTPIGCGGPSSPSALPQQSILTFASQPGDWIGGGRTYRFTSDNATFRHAIDPPYRGSILVTVLSDDRQSHWTIALQAPGGQELQVGSYERAEAWTPALPGNRPRFSLLGDGRSCGASEGGFVIKQLAYEGTVMISTGATVPVIDRLHVLFEQRCTATSAPGLTGEVSFIATP
jgi:hypothetical protein